MRNHTFETMGTVVSIAYGETTAADMTAATEQVFRIFDRYDREFSTYRDDSFISAINAGTKEPLDITTEALDIFELAEHYREETQGYFDIINPDGKTDPSGIVKSYAIREAGSHLASLGLDEWCINAGGDILSASKNRGFTAGIVNPFDRTQMFSHISLRTPFAVLATSGLSERGEHIWNPKAFHPSDVIQASVVSDDIIYSDVMATVLVAAGSSALPWVEKHENAEALLVKRDGDFAITSGYLSLVPR